MSEPEKKGAGRPKNSTTEEMELRIDIVADLICKLRTKGEISAFCQNKWAISPRMVENYISRANALLKKRATMSRDEAREMGVLMLLELARNGSDLIRMRAEERLAAIFGYNAPKQMEVSGRDGKPLEYRNMTPEERKQRLDEIFGRTVKPTNGNGNGHADKSECLIPPRN